MLPATARRSVREDAATHRIREATRERVRACAASPGGIESRLRELDREWDLERTLEANASSLILAGLALGTFVDRRLYLLPAAGAGFLLQHALQGWCPPLPLLRRLGFRSQTEIEGERHALLAVRGDYRDTDPASGGTAVWRADKALCAAGYEPGRERGGLVRGATE